MSDKIETTEPLNDSRAEGGRLHPFCSATLGAEGGCMNVSWLRKALEKIEAMCGTSTEIAVVVELDGAEYETKGVDLTGYTPGDRRPLRLKIMAAPCAQSQSSKQAHHPSRDHHADQTSMAHES